MLKIGVGSKNPAKIEAVKSAFIKMGFDIEAYSIEVDSGVSDQPFSDEETIEGAIHRAKNVLSHSNDAFDYGIGLEGGVIETEYGAFVCNWGAIIDRDGKVGIGGGNRILLPQNIIERLKIGYELGDVIDQVTGKHDIKKNEGTIGILTQGNITRSEVFQDVVITAFSRFLSPDLYEENNNKEVR